jgi:hypothetical protein
MDREEQMEAVHRCMGAGMQLAAATWALSVLGADDNWLTGNATPKMKSDLLAALDSLEAAHRQLGRRILPRPSRALLTTIAALRAQLSSWDTGGAVPAKLVAAGMELLGAMHLYEPAPGSVAPEADAAEEAESLDTLGLPLPRTSLRIEYSASSGSLVVTVTPKTSARAHPFERLFVRRIDEPRYREIVFAEDEHLESLAICGGQPYAYVHTLISAPDEWGLNDGGVARLWLPEGRLERLPAVHWGHNNESKCWTAQLLGVSPDGTAPIVIASDGGRRDETGCRIGYRLAELDPATSCLTDIAAMPGVFA